MGGKEGGGPTTVGYHYFLSMHLVICQGPVDKIKQISSSDDIIIHSGDITKSGDNQVITYIKKPNLYGGPKKEGGVQGTLVTLFGGDNQQPSPILKDLLGGVLVHRNLTGAVASTESLWNDWKARINSLTPLNSAKITPDSAFQSQYLSAFRGVTSVLWDNMLYQTNSSRPKGWKFKVERTPFVDDETLPFKSIDQNIQPVSDPYGLSYGIKFTKSATGKYSLFGRQIIFTSSGGHASSFVLDGRTYLYRSNLQGYVHGWWRGALSTDSQGNTVDSAPVILDTGLDGVEEQRIFGLLRNAPTQPAGTIYPVKSSDTTLLTGDIIKSANPAYIILECLSNKVWGLGLDPGVNSLTVDRASFVTAATTLAAEGFGLSAIWLNESSIEEFMSTILGTINAVVYVDPKSGKFVIKLLRAADESELTVNEDNIMEVRGFARSGVSELVNQLTIQWTDPILGGPKSLTVHNSAARELQGHTVAVSKTYSAVTDDKLAATLANRDLAMMSQSLAGVELVMNRSAADLVIGSVIDWSWADYGIQNMSLRVNSISFGLTGDGRITAKCSENLFKTSLTKYSSLSPIDSPRVDVNCEYPAVSRLLSLNHLDMFRLRSLGTMTSQDILNTDPTSGVVAVLAKAPNDNSNQFKVMFSNSPHGFIYTSDLTTNYTDLGSLQFTPYAQLATNINKTVTTLNLTDTSMLNLVVASTTTSPSYLACCQGDKVEIMEVVSIVNTPGNSAVTVKRGIASTVAKSFLAEDSEVWFYSGDLDQRVIQKEFAEDSNIYIKTLTEVNKRVYPMNDSARMISTKVKTWVSPYPVAKLQVSVTNNSVIAILWLHRDAELLQEKLVGQQDPGDTPHTSGIYYAVCLYKMNGTLLTPTALQFTSSQQALGVYSNSFTYVLDPSLLMETSIVVAVRAVQGMFYSEPNYVVISPQNNIVLDQEVSDTFFGTFAPPEDLIVQQLELSLIGDFNYNEAAHQIEFAGDSVKFTFKTNIESILSTGKLKYSETERNTWFKHYVIEIYDLEAVDIDGNYVLLATKYTKEDNYEYRLYDNVLDHTTPTPTFMMKIYVEDNLGVKSSRVSSVMGKDGIAHVLPVVVGSDNISHPLSTTFHSTTGLSVPSNAPREGVVAIFGDVDPNTLVPKFEVFSQPYCYFKTGLSDDAATAYPIYVKSIDGASWVLQDAKVDMTNFEVLIPFDLGVIKAYSLYKLDATTKLFTEVLV